MTFDLVVTISMHYYERCQTKRDVSSDDFVDIFWGHHKIEQYLNVISMHFRVFSEGQGTEWRILFGLLKRQIFIWGA